MNLKVPDENTEFPISSEILLSDNNYLRQWLVIIGIVTIVLLLLLSCAQCILKMRRIYRTIDLNEPCLTSNESFSRQRLLSIDGTTKCTCYPKLQCIKSKDGVYPMSTEYLNSNQYRILNKKSSSSVYIV